MKKIINLNNEVDFTKEPMFFGEGLNIQRYDKFRYSNLFELYKKQLSFFWRPEEVDIAGKDRSDFDTLAKHEKLIVVSTLSTLHLSYIFFRKIILVAAGGPRYINILG